MKFGEMIRNLRINNTKMSLRIFCKFYGYDHVTQSKLERCRIQPPLGDDLKRLLHDVKVEVNGGLWDNLIHKAEQEQGVKIEPLTEKELMQKLPMFPHKANGEKFTEDELKQLAQTIRDNW